MTEFYFIVLRLDLLRNNIVVFNDVGIDLFKPQSTDVLEFNVIEECHENPLHATLQLNSYLFINQ